MERVCNFELFLKILMHYVSICYHFLIQARSSYHQNLQASYLFSFDDVKHSDLSLLLLNQTVIYWQYQCLRIRSYESSSKYFFCHQKDSQKPNYFLESRFFFASFLIDSFTITSQSKSFLRLLGL